MNEPQERRSLGLTRILRLVGRLGAPYAVIAGVVAIVLIFLGYDLAKGRLSPCDAIFEESAVGLSTRIRFLKTEAELQLGKDALTELDERAQMTALNLKTCCTVLDAGRLDPEQFLQCKAKARAYDASVEDIAALVRSAVKEASARPAAVAAPAEAPKPAPSIAPALEAKVAAAREVSRAFNRQVVEVRREQALQTLEAARPEHLEIAAEEREPNDGPLATNILELDKWVTGSVGAPKDSDHYSFTTPATHRDWIRIELENRSTTLEPRLELFDSEKSSLAEVHKTTPGADLAYPFVATPATRYTVRVSNYYGESVGVYLLRVVATRSYDAQEPNDGILNAKPISVGAAVAAQIMDRRDLDHFSFAVPSGDNAMIAKLENRSTTLHPKLSVFDATKAVIGEQQNTTKGGDVSLAFKARGPAIYFVRVSDYYSDGSGDYALTVTRQEPPEPTR
jgi:hypothetical protein